MMTKKTFLPFFLILTAFVTLSCGLFDTIGGVVGGAGGDSGAAVNEMWSDVPLMHGLDKSDTGIPIAIRMALNVFLSASGQKGGAMSFMAFTTGSRSVQEIMDFYNPDLMGQSGWNSSNQPGCGLADPEESNGNPGAGCFYMKEGADRRGSVLAIMMAEDPGKGSTNVFFIRLDNVDFTQESQ